MKVGLRGHVAGRRNAARFAAVLQVHGEAVGLHQDAAHLAALDEREHFREREVGRVRPAAPDAEERDEGDREARDRDDEGLARRREASKHAGNSASHRSATLPGAHTTPVWSTGVSAVLERSADEPRTLGVYTELSFCKPLPPLNLAHQ
jgi:hypothetical protein